MRHIVQVHPVRKLTFEEKLEERASRIAKDLEKRTWDTELSTIVEREIALTLDHLHSVRSFHDHFIEKLLKLERDVDQDYATMTKRLGYDFPAIRTERDSIRVQRFNLERELRFVAAAQQDKTQMLHDRLLSLLNRHRQMRLEDEN